MSEEFSVGAAYRAVIPNLWYLMPDDLRWSWYNNNRNKVYSKYNAFESSSNHLSTPTCQSEEKLSSMKSVTGVKSVGDHCYRINADCKWSLIIFGLYCWLCKEDKISNAYFVCVLAVQSSPTLCDPMDCSPPGSSVYGILQARILEWVAIPFSRGSSQPRDLTQVSALQADSLPSEPQKKPSAYFRETQNSA